jgi:hypothetical protein
MTLRLALLIGLQIFTVLLPTPASAKILIVSSRGPSADRLPPGTVLPEPLNLKLKAGDEVTLLDAIGVRHVSGPGTVKATPTVAASSTMLDSLRTLFVTSKARRAQLAAVRTMAGPSQSIAAESGPSGNAPQTGGEQPPNLWYVSARAGNWCVPDPTLVELWRPSSSQGVELTVSALDGNSVSMRWPKGENVTVWPDAVGVRDGSQYALRLEDQPEAIVTLRVIPSVSDDLLGIAQQLFERQCDEQLLSLSEQGL